MNFLRAFPFYLSLSLSLSAIVVRPYLALNLMKIH